MPFAISEARELRRKAGEIVGNDEVVVKCIPLPLYKFLRPKNLYGVGCEDVLCLSRDSYFTMAPLCNAAIATINQHIINRRIIDCCETKKNHIVIHVPIDNFKYCALNNYPLSYSKNGNSLRIAITPKWRLNVTRYYMVSLNLHTFDSVVLTCHIIHKHSSDRPYVFIQKVRTSEKMSGIDALSMCISFTLFWVRNDDGTVKRGQCGRVRL